MQTESQQIDRLLFQERLVARLSGFFGLLALVLACVGLFALLSCEVSRRTREIGIRLALGARLASVLRLVLRQGIGLAIVGHSGKAGRACPSDGGTAIPVNIQVNVSARKSPGYSWLRS